MSADALVVTLGCVRPKMARWQYDLPRNWRHMSDAERQAWISDKVAETIEEKRAALEATWQLVDEMGSEVASG